jgi:hypothetical protein
VTIQLRAYEERIVLHFCGSALKKKKDWKSNRMEKELHKIRLEKR